MTSFILFVHLLMSKNDIFRQIQASPSNLDNDPAIMNDQ
uniref:Uncharacterized protein n=1 Tax=Lepeophtheirus salmonis TaxID=72036 RepID=A0A0K2UIM8_LEPSM